MGERKTVRLEQAQLDAIEDMDKLGLADNESEALRSALNVGLTEYGVLNGGHYDSRLRQMARRFGDAFALVVVVLLGITFFSPVELRVYAAAPMAASLACYGIDRALKHYEPGVSRRLGVLGGEKA